MATSNLLAGLLASAAFIVHCSNAQAHENIHHHHHHAMQAAPCHMVSGPEVTASTMAYQSAMQRMHDQMMMVRYTGDTDIDFAAGMVPHHQGAVDMARIELIHGRNQHLRMFAAWILQAQETESGMMRSWLYGRASERAPAVYSPSVASYKAVMEHMHEQMAIEYSGDPDVDFVRAMIPHHQGAVDMAVIELRSGKNRDMHALASSIIQSQTQEIAWMQHWLARHQPIAK